MFKYLKAGSCRKVYEINDDLVIKIPINSWGIDQCKTEIEAFKLYGDILPLCPIDLNVSDENRIVMTRVQELENLPLSLNFDCICDIITDIQHERETFESIEKLQPEVKNFVQQILYSGLTRDQIWNILYDVSFENLGYKNNEIYILDYGYFFNLNELDIVI